MLHDLTTYTEYDPNARATVAANAIAAVGVRQGDVRVTRDFGGQYLYGQPWRLRTRAKTGVGYMTVGVWGASHNTYDAAPTEFGNWTDGLVLYWEYDSGSGNYKLILQDRRTGSSAATPALTPNTYYYIDVRRVFETCKVRVYSDATYSPGALLHTLTLSAVHAQEWWTTHYALVTQVTAAADPAWGLLDEEWTDYSAWTTTGVGTLEINPAGTLHILPNASNSRGLYRTVAAVGTADEVTFELEESFAGLGTYASSNGHNFAAQCKGNKKINLLLHTDGCYYLNASTQWIKLGSMTFSAATTYQWRVVYSSLATPTVWIYVRVSGGPWQLVGSYASIYGSGDSSGRIDNVVYRGGSGSSEMSQTFMRVASGKHLPTWFGSLDVDIENVEELRITVTSAKSILTAQPDATLTHDMETFPGAAWTKDTSGAADITQSNLYAHAGTYSARIQGAAGGHARIEAAAGSPTAYHQQRSCFVKPVSLADGEFAGLLYFRNAAATRLVHAGYYRVGAKYLWGLRHYDGAAITDYRSTYQLTLNQEYFFHLNKYNDGGTGTTLLIDGEAVVNINAYNGQADFIGIGAYSSSYGGTYEAFVDDYREHGKFCVTKIGLAPTSNNVVLGGALRNRHSEPVEAPSSYFLAGPDGENVAWKQNNQVAGKIHGTNNIVAVGANLYAMDLVYQYAADSQYQTPVYKSVNGGLSYSQAAWIAAYTATPTDIIVGGKILCVAWDVPQSGIGNSTLKSVLYNPATESFDAPLGTIALGAGVGGPFANCFPNESGIIVNPKRGKYGAYVRWDEYVGGDTMFITYTESDDLITWGPHTIIPGLNWCGGSPKMIVMSNYCWMSGYRRIENTGSPSFSVLIQLDLATMDVLAVKAFGIMPKTGYGGLEVGDGGLVLDETGTFGHLAHANGSGYYHQFTADDLYVSPPVKGGFPVLNRMRRMRRAA